MAATPDRRNQSACGRLATASRRDILDDRWREWFWGIVLDAV
jgi:hypothetical protein